MNLIVYMNVKKSKAFTLVELLVVIAITGIMVTGITAMLGNSRLAARDSRRLNDVKSIQDALEFYKSTERFYPSVITPGRPLVGLTSGLTFLTSVPSDPAPNDGNCNGFGYQYTTTSTSGYVISYCLGKGTGKISGGIHYAKPTGVDVIQ
jgi:prepilin-type N-terminal cleavage/methylation domain-containing protein